MELVRVRVPCRWADGDGVADFKLGLGPCGKVVQFIMVDYCETFVTVIQGCGDEMKKFRYLHSQITGRIEETYS